MEARVYNVEHDAFHVRMRAMRIALDKSQEWLSSRIKTQSITSHYISMYERGKLAVQPDMQQEINDIFTRELKNQRLVLGKWKTEYVMLRYYVEIVNICKQDPKEQKLAYESLRTYVNTLSDLPEYSLTMFAEEPIESLEIQKEVIS